MFFCPQMLKKTPSKVAQKISNPLFFLTALTAQTEQTEEFMFQNVAYWPTVYRNGELGIHEKKKWAMYVSMNWQNDKSQASRNCQDCLMSKWTITHVTFKGNPSSQILFTNSLQITNTWYSALWFSIQNIFCSFMFRIQC